MKYRVATLVILMAALGGAALWIFFLGGKELLFGGGGQAVGTKRVKINDVVVEEITVKGASGVQGLNEQYPPPGATIAPPVEADGFYGTVLSRDGQLLRIEDVGLQARQRTVQIDDTTKLEELYRDPQDRALKRRGGALEGILKGARAHVVLPAGAEKAESVRAEKIEYSYIR